MALLVATVADIVLAYTTVRLKAWRTCPQRLSLGDENKVTLHFRNYSLTPLRLKVIDELPVQLQQRDFRLDVRMDAKDKRTMDYSLRPTSRGEYGFGNLLVYVFSFEQKCPQDVPEAGSYLAYGIAVQSLVNGESRIQDFFLILGVIA